MPMVIWKGGGGRETNLLQKMTEEEKEKGKVTDSF